MDRNIRSRERSIVDAFDAFDQPHDGPKTAFVGKVTSAGSISTTGQVYYLVHPVDVSGPEVEGGAPTLTVDTSKTIVVAMIVGNPVVDDYLIVEPQGDRWVTEKMVVGGGGGSTGTIPGCHCTPIPATLTLTVVNPGTPDYGDFQDATITYQPLPSCLTASGLPANIFTSYPTGFIDAISGATFYYYLSCTGNLFQLSRFFCTSPYGSPYEEVPIYQWLVGGTNTCSPFRLESGTDNTSSGAVVKLEGP